MDATRLHPGGNKDVLDAEGLQKLIVKNAQRLLQAFPLEYYSEDGVIDQTIVFIDEIDKLANDIILPEKENLFTNCFGLKHTILSDSDKKDIINKALKSGQGVRSLKRELEDIFSELEFNYEISR